MPREMSEGRTRNVNAVVYSSDKLTASTRLVWAVAVLENDDGIPQGYENALRGAPWWDILREPFNAASIGGLIWDAAKKEKEDQKFVSNDDEFLGWKSVPYDPADLVKARHHQGWHKRSVEVKGDGGHYRLTFAISAGPKP
jgi:hypothetical protein